MAERTTTERIYDEARRLYDKDCEAGEGVAAGATVLPWICLTQAEKDEYLDRAAQDVNGTGPR